MNPALKSHLYDRAIGTVVGSAVGDALGSQYEFGPAHPDTFEPSFGHSVFGHGVGEWTDDTQMAMPILEELARGASLNDTVTLGRIITAWQRWRHDALDVGAQTSAVLEALGEDPTEASGRAAARAVHDRAGRSGGNGSLMRTGPVALGYLADDREADLADAAGRIAQLTHWETDNLDAVVLWCLAIRHAIRTGTLDLEAGLDFVPAGARRARWSDLIDRASAPGAHPRDFKESNGRVVVAFLGAAAAIIGASDYRGAITRAIQGGGDTDTVAAITGALAGALHGVSGIPLSWQRTVHGWPGYDVNDLSALALLAARGGTPTPDGSLHGLEGAEPLAATLPGKAQPPNRQFRVILACSWCCSGSNCHQGCRQNCRQTRPQHHRRRPVDEQSQRATKTPATSPRTALNLSEVLRDSHSAVEIVRVSHLHGFKRI